MGCLPCCLFCVSLAALAAAFCRRALSFVFSKLLILCCSACSTRPQLLLLATRLDSLSGRPLTQTLHTYSTAHTHARRRRVSKKEEKNLQHTEYVNKAIAPVSDGLCCRQWSSIFSINFAASALAISAFGAAAVGDARRQFQFQSISRCCVENLQAPSIFLGDGRTDELLLCCTPLRVFQHCWSGDDGPQLAHTHLLARSYYQHRGRERNAIRRRLAAAALVS